MGKGSFAPGMMVLMADGTEKEIENVVKGEEVLTYNTTTNELEANLVSKTRSLSHGNLINYTLNDGKLLSCSFQQPIYTLDFVIASWDHEGTIESYNSAFECEQFRCLSLLFNADTKLFDLEVAALEPDWSKDDKITYKLEVENNHNYFVQKVLVRE
jgi:hypothetical protein